MRGRRLAQVLSAVLVVGGGGLGATVVNATTAFAAPRTAIVTPNGPTAPIAFTAGGQAGTVTVQGLAGQQLTVATSGGTFADNCGLALELLSPTGATVGASACAGQSGAVSSASLPADGLYKASFLSATGASGTVAIAATSNAGPPSITAGAEALTVPITTPDQDLRFGFTAAKGDVVSVTSADGNLPDCNVSLRFVNAAGVAVGASADPCAGASGSAEVPITKKATYFVQIVHNATVETGTLGLVLARASDQTGPIDPGGAILRNGTPKSFTLSTPGQSARYTFSGLVSQHVSTLLNESTIGPGCPTVLLAFVRPDASVAGSISTCTDTAFLDTVTIDQAGIWTILVDPQGDATGSATLQAFNSADQSDLIHLDNTAVTVAITSPGQNARWRFSAASGASISAAITNATFPGCPAFLLSLERPDGSTLGDPVSSCDAGAVLDAQVLDEDGTWSVIVDPQGTATGTAVLTALSSDGDNDVRPITINGAPLNIDLGSGRNGEYTFAGTTGQLVSAQVTGSTFPDCAAYELWLMRPDGTQLGDPVNGCGASAFLDRKQLDATGTWAFVFDPQGTGSGTAQLQAYSFTDETGTVTLTGKVTKLVLAKPGERARYTFAGTAGQGISATINQSTIPGCPAFALSLERPDGSTLNSVVSTCTSSVFLDVQTLDQTGTWTVVVDPYAASTGTASLRVYNVVDDSRTLKPKGQIKSFTSSKPGMNGHFSFHGHTGDSRTVAISGSTFAGCPGLVISFVRPDGSVLTTDSTCNGSLVLGPSVLDVDGTWNILVDPQGPAIGTLVIKLT